MKANEISSPKENQRGRNVKYYHGRSDIVIGHLHLPDPPRLASLSRPGHLMFISKSTAMPVVKLENQDMWRESIIFSADTRGLESTSDIPNRRSVSCERVRIMM
jgi:hypothetical protein